MLTTFRRRSNRDLDTMTTRLSTDFSRGHQRESECGLEWGLDGGDQVALCLSPFSD